MADPPQYEILGGDSRIPLQNKKRRVYRKERELITNNFITEENLVSLSIDMFGNLWYKIV